MKSIRALSVVSTTLTLLSSCAPSPEPSAGSPDAHVLTVSEAPSAERTGDARSPAARNDLSSGRLLYQHHCMDCHGPSGKGDGKRAADLGTDPTDLTSSDVAQSSDSELFASISRGRRPMPNFGKLLSPDQRWLIVRFVRTLPTTTAARGSHQ